MKPITLSFCIPSYNREEMTLMMVNSILEYKGNDIEVIVVDNHSTDATVESLKKISDERLRVIVNEENIGAVGNFVESLRYGCGKYSFVALSRERIIGERIPNLLKFLEGNDYSVVYCGSDNKDENNVEWGKGSEAALYLGYRDRHPTGWIYNTEQIQEIIKRDDSKRAAEKYLHFPHDIWAVELALKGNAAFYGKVIRKRVDLDYLSKEKTQFASKGVLWFAPDERMKQFQKYMEHLASLQVDEITKEKIFAETYHTLLLESFFYRAQMRNKIICQHYNVEPRNIVLHDILRIGHNAKSVAKSVIKKNDFLIHKKTEFQIQATEIYILLRYMLVRTKEAFKKKN